MPSVPPARRRHRPCPARTAAAAAAAPPRGRSWPPPPSPPPLWSRRRGVKTPHAWHAPPWQPLRAPAPLQARRPGHRTPPSRLLRPPWLQAPSQATGCPLGPPPPSTALLPTMLSPLAAALRGCGCGLWVSWTTWPPLTWTTCCPWTLVGGVGAVGVGVDARRRAPLLLAGCVLVWRGRAAAQAACGRAGEGPWWGRRRGGSTASVAGSRDRAQSAMDAAQSARARARVQPCGRGAVQGGGVERGAACARKQGACGLRHACAAPGNTRPLPHPSPLQTTWQLPSWTAACRCRQTACGAAAAAPPPATPTRPRRRCSRRHTQRTCGSWWRRAQQSGSSQRSSRQHTPHILQLHASLLLLRMPCRRQLHGSSLQRPGRQRRVRRHSLLCPR